MKFLMVLGVLAWIMVAVWLVRLGMGLEHLSKDQIPAMIIGGISGGLGSWFFVARPAKKRTASQN